MAPEMHGTDYGLPADLYAFGIMLFEIVTRRPFFTNDEYNALENELRAEAGYYRNGKLGWRQCNVVGRAAGPGPRHSRGLRRAGRGRSFGVHHGLSALRALRSTHSHGRVRVARLYDRHLLPSPMILEDE